MQTRTTPVPNALFDVHLKHLNSTELKVILVIIRQTLGWEDKKTNSGRKQLDWIAGSQLQIKTGCSRRALTSAIDILIKRKMIQVLDDRWNILSTPEQRQGKTRLYYRLCSSVENDVSIDPTCAEFAEDLRKNCTALVQQMHITK